MRVVLDQEAVSRGLRRVAGEIVERHRGTDGLVLVGIRRGGVPLAQQIADWILQLEGQTIPVGSVDITLYRDDAATALPNPRIGPSEIPCALEGRRVVLIDDVLFTGRTVRAAIDALMDWGRPRRIELGVLIDRGGRELPIAPDYLVRAVEVLADERVDVVEHDGRPVAVVRPASHPTTPPPKP
ncbi:MAG TPA: bifunctional pyr operon transcriptional regulator/uracil phosphoribosyltransferase PyrR [Polyangiaceae bacterium]|nr:bifunctional pyr operon transcriptional regulator/uracil phosphoribosyltransferase PyrR [Polyangiaceae bacterium]